MQQRAIAEVNLLYDAWFHCLVSQAKFVGISVAVMVGNEHAYVRAIGKNSTSCDRALEPHHLFCIGSQSKTLTAAIIMRLVERGKIDLYERAARYLPWLNDHPDKVAARITVQQLMRHTSGLSRDGSCASYWALQEPFPSVGSLQQRVLASSFVCRPATTVKYSNLGYALLGQIIETVSGMTYADAAYKNVIDPLGLCNTYPTIDHVGSGTVADGHTRYFHGRRTAYAQAVATNALSSATGWYSTPAELAVLFRALHTDDSLLSKQSRAMLLHGEKRYLEDSASQYGAGLMRLTLESGTALLGHAGAYFGHHSCTMYNPATDHTVSIAINCPDTNPTIIAIGVHELLLSYCEDQPWMASDRFNGIFASTSSRRYVGALGQNYASYNLQELRPQLTRDLLTKHDQRTLRIKESSYIGYRDESAVYTFDERNVATHILYGGIPAQRINNKQL